LPTFFPDQPWYFYLAFQVGAIFVVWFYGSFAEWALHRFIMHSKFIPRFPFEAHALVHHKLFRADESFHASTDEQMHHVSFNWWDHVTLNLIHLGLFAGLEYVTGLPVLIGCMVGVSTYLIAYESIHYVFHVPGNRFFEKHRWFLWLKEHHLIHHKQHFRNLNVVIPVADFVLRTRRSARVLAESEVGSN
jgi:hypothetical protein